MIDDKTSEEEKVTPITSRLVRSVLDLVVYQKAYALSLEIHKATLRFPAVENYGLSSQLRRSTKSICANLAEGFIRQKSSKPDFARFLIMAESSAAESQTWLQYAKDLDYITIQQYEYWYSGYTEVISMLSKLRKKL